MHDPRQIWEHIVRPGSGDLAPEVARYFLSLCFTPEEKDRCEVLSGRRQLELSADEQNEWMQLMHANTVLMLLQEKARRSLERQPTA